MEQSAISLSVGSLNFSLQKSINALVAIFHLIELTIATIAITVIISAYIPIVLTCLSALPLVRRIVQHFELSS